MSTWTPMNADELRASIGETVTVIPAVTFSADRDTEPGAQPWKATLVGVTLDGKAIIQQEGYDPRPMNGEAQSHPVGGIQIGSW